MQQLSEPLDIVQAHFEVETAPQYIQKGFEFLCRSVQDDPKAEHNQGC